MCVDMLSECVCKRDRGSVCACVAENLEGRDQSSEREREGQLDRQKTNYRTAQWSYKKKVIWTQ